MITLPHDMLMCVFLPQSVREYDRRINKEKMRNQSNVTLALRRVLCVS